MDGALIREKTLQKERLTDSQAQQIAVNKVRGPVNTGKVTITKKEKVAVNPKLLGLSNDEKTYPAVIVVTNQNTKGIDDPRRTIVSLTDGSVLSTIELADYAMDRQVYDCQQNQSGQCPLVRQEGSADSGVADADSAYGFTGEAYQFYSSKLQRDSYDNQGSPIKTFVNLPDTINGQKLCPNARWLQKDTGVENQLQVCPGWVTRDIVSHELTHGVVEYTAHLDFLNQSGALNEAIADTFATGVDDNWTIGEGLSIGAIRHIDDPSQNRSPSSSGGTVANPMPDHLFSSRYYCGTQDRGGVHLNMSIPTKAYYLMVVGGDYNGCTMSSIGKDKALLVWYQALTKYLGVTSNFRDAYDGLVQGCADLYGSTSNECLQVTKSLQAVEMDQQPLGDQTSPKCNNISAAPATCIGAVNPTAGPTAVPTGGSCSFMEGDANHDGSVDVIDFATWKRIYRSLPR
jgi:Zn-dependent metalloprotease